MPVLQPSCPEDDAFLFEVYQSTRLEEFAAVGWTEQALTAFLRMQYEVQKRAYRNQYPMAEYELVMLEGVRIGRIMTTDTVQAIVLIDIALLPPYRNKGLGTRLIRDLQEKAALSRKPLRLSVLDGNPVQALYARLGFSIIGQQFPYIFMEWADSGWS